MGDIFVEFFKSPLFLIILKAIISSAFLLVYLYYGAVVYKLERQRIKCTPSMFYPYYLVQNNATAPEPEKRFDNRFCGGGDHATYCVVGTLLVGGNIMIFRVLRYLRTRFIKYLHVVIHAAALYLFGEGIRLVYIQEYGTTHGSRTDHEISSYMIVTAFVVQWVAGLIIFLYIYPNCRIRQSFSGLHAMFGTWIFLCLVACCLNGMRFTAMEYERDTAIDFFIYCCVCFIIVVIVTLNPVLEWTLVSGVLLVNSFCVTNFGIFRTDQFKQIKF